MGLLSWGAIMSATSAILAIGGKEDMLSPAYLSFLATLCLLAFVGWYTIWGFSSNSRQASGSGRSDIKVRKINDSLFVLNEPESPISPEIEIVFFHGFHSSDSSDMHLRTWEVLLEDGPCIWPSTWLVESFPKARVLYVSYDAVLERREGSFDLRIIAENLASDFMEAGIGQTPNCPVILVGHGFGGLVIKQLCLDINNSISLQKSQRQKIKLENFLRRMKGTFYYGMPQRGSLCVDRARDLHTNPLLQYFKILNKEAIRVNYDFSHLCTVREWEIQGLGESSSSNQGVFQGVIVAPEACSRDGDEFNVVPADHVSITKPESKEDRRFYAITGLVDRILVNKKVEVLGHQCLGLPDNPMELDKRAEEVKEKLKDEPILGIVGMGGIGKSTLAKQVYNNISAEFEYTCFLPNIKDVGRGGLEDWVQSHFYRNGRRVDKIQWEELKNKETLIVADDVDKEDQLRVLPKLQNLGDGSKIIITSRDQGILSCYEKYCVYEAKFLEMDAAQRLFCRHAFGQEGRPGPSPQTNHLEENVTKVVRKCGGLPLTLEVMGCYLRKHATNANIWKETIKRLENALAITGGKEDRVWASLQVSYDALSPGEQEMFVEAATVFSGWELKIADAVWSITIDASETTWENLINRSMVRVSDGYVWVHDQLKDLAKKLAKGYHIESYQSEADEFLRKLHSNEVNANPTSLSLVSSTTPIQLDSLVRLENLRYLRLTTSAGYEGSGEIFPRRLSMLTWSSGHPLHRTLFPIRISDMNNLAYLDLHCWRVGEGFSKALGRLTNLRVLSLSLLRGLDSLPEDFGNLSHLKELSLTSVSLPRLPESLGQLSALEVLSLHRVDCSELPESFGDLSSLVTLSVGECKKLASLPASFGRGLKSLQRLEISDCPLLEFRPNSFSQLRALRKLDIRRCDQLKELEDAFGNLSELRCLCLMSKDLAKLPENLGSLTSLRELTVESDCLERLPDSLGDLVRLEVLRLSINSVKALPDSLGKLSSVLETLRITANSLESLPNNLGDLVRLKGLNLSINSVKALPDSLGKLSSVLETLIITANSLESLPNYIGLLSSLRRLDLIDCNCLDKLPESLGDLLSLETLVIRSKRLKSLPESIGRLQSMRNFTLGAERVMSLPESIGQLKSLQRFSLCCEKLERLPDRMDHLPLSSLALTLTGERGAETLPKGLDNLSTLGDLTLGHFRFRKLPEEIEKLPALRSLKIKRWESPGHLYVHILSKRNEAFVLPPIENSARQLRKALTVSSHSSTRRREGWENRREADLPTIGYRL